MKHNTPSLTFKRSISSTLSRSASYHSRLSSSLRILCAAIMLCLSVEHAWGTSYIPGTRKTVTSDETITYTTMSAANATTNGQWIVNPSGNSTSSKKYTNVTGDNNGNPGGITDNIASISSNVKMPTVQVPSTAKYNQNGKYVLHMRIIGIEGMIVHGVTGSSGRGVAIYGQEYSASLVETTEYGTALASMTRSSNSGSFLLKYSGFDATKEYLITVAATGGDVNLYAIELLAPSCTGPSITAFSNSEGHTYNLGDAATTMSVTATAGDGGALSYKWYQYDDGQDPTTQAVEAAGTNNAASYTPSTASAYTNRHFFCVVSEAGCSTTAKSAYSGAISVTAPTYSVTVNVNDASYGSASAASTTVSQGSTTTITATPNSGYQFDHWTVSGTGASLSSATDNPTTLTMGTTSVTVTAYFVEATCPTSGTLYTLEMKSGQSYSVPASTETNLVSTYATVSGGGAYIGNIGSSDGKAQVKTDGSGTVYFNGADAYIKIVLDCPLQTGDSLYFTNGSGERQICFTTTTTRSTTYATTSNKYEFPAAFDGISTIYIWRSSGSSTYVHTINILRPAAKADANVYAFSSDTFNDWGSCNGGTLTLAGSQSGVNYQLYKDGVASGSPVAGTGSALNFTVTTSGTYTVKSVANATYNETAMTGSAVVNIQDPTLAGASSVAIGSTITLTHPNYTTGGDNWESSNTAVATVNNAGVVTGVSAGTATITFHGVGSCDGTKEITVYDGSVTYSVTYNGNGSTSGSVPVDVNSPYAANATVTVLGNTGSLEKTDYSFSGWNTAADGSGTSYAAGATFTITANTTLYAQWAFADACETFKYVWKVTGNFCDDQSTATSAVSMFSNNYYLTLTGLNHAQSSGSSFNLDKSAGNYFLFTAKTGWQISSVCFYGKIQDDYVYKTTDGSDWSSTITSTNKGGDAYYSLDVNASCFGIKLSGAEGIWIRNMVIEVCPTAEAIYSVTYNGNGNTGGSAPTDANTYAYGNSATVLGNTGSMTKTLYRFDGWNTKADGSGVDKSAGSTITITQDTTLYAQWVPDCTDPIITTQPSNYTMVHGGAALLACAADHGTYQWYNLTDNTAAGTGAAGTAVTVGSGYNAGGWTTPVINTNGQYQYYCVITDGLCSVTTNTVTLTVQDEPTVATAITLSGADEVVVNNSIQLSVTYTPANANTDTTLTWVSSDPTIATVNEHGTVTGVALGTVTITATTANGKSDTHTITVVPIVVTLNANGGTVTPASLVYSGTSLILPTPARAGYAFMGWYTDADEGTRVAQPYAPAVSITLYAHWESTSLALHIPGVYETDYGQTLTTYDSKKYEIYGFTSTGSNVNFLWAGTPTTTMSAPNCLMQFAAQETVVSEWISQEMHGRGSSGSMSSAEFVASGVYAMNYRDDRPLQIRIKGFESFAILAQDANATKATGKYLQVLINGEDVTANLSTSLSVRRYPLDKNTEYLIVVKGIGGSNNALWGFSLQVPDCTQPTLEWATTPNNVVVKETSGTATVSTNYPAGVTYTSDNPSVMTVSGNGTSTASLSFLTAGSVTLTAMVTGDDGTYCNSPIYITKEFTVLDAPIPATAISLEDVAIEVGESLQLVPIWTPTNATNAETSGYVTGSTSIATVTPSGVLTGVAIGRTTVTVTSVSGLTCTANVIVRPAAIPCESWEGVPASWSAGQLMVGDLVLSGSSPDGNTNIANAKAYDNINATVINVSSKNVYVEGSFAGGYDIQSLSLGVASNSSTTSTYNYALILSPTAVFNSSTMQVVLLKAHGYNMPQNIQTVSVPAGMKYFRIYRYTNEFGDEYGDNQSLRIYHIEACPVTPCSEKAGSISITSGSAEDCPGNSRTLTFSGYETGADIQWYKDGTIISGATSATLVTTEAGDYYATSTNVCEKRSTNSITLADTPAPSATALLTELYVKDGRPQNIDLFTLEGASTWSVTPAITGCEYTLVNGTIHLSGTPTIASNSNTTMTLTVNNTCSGATATATISLHLLAATAKPTLAYVVTGTKNGDWLDANSEGTALSNYLSTYYDVTVVNGYATNNEARIKAYYSQFDVVLVTDYPDTNTGPSSGTDGAGGRSYTNAIGCLIDIKPILTLETFVSKLDNWQISSDPKNTSSVRKMKVLCTSHNIFDSTLFEGTEQDEITILSGGTMQGFEPTLAPNYMFIATIDNGGETLVNCCERQIMVGARMILLGIQHEAMGSITDKGKTVIHNIIEYLLLTDPNGMADCSIVFDDNNGTHIWSDAANWGPAHNKIPTPYQKVRIEKPCTVDITSAAASSLTLRKDNGNNANGSITINANASLSVIGTIREVRGTDYITTYPVSAEDLVVKSNASNQGALAQGDEDGLTHATVQFYARGINSPSTDTQWQYMGTPFSDVAHAVDHYENSWMCRWNEDTEGFSDTNWEWVRNDDAVVPFVGYALSQTNSKTFTLTGTLVPSTEKTIRLTASSPTEWSGWNLLANSWMAPINISQFETSDFGSAEATIYVMNTGKNDGNQSASGSESSTAGQYVAIPIASAGSMAATAQQIPPMQGFYVLTTAATTLTLDYNKLIYTPTFTNTTYPNRTPRRMSAAEDEEEVLTNTVMPRLIIDVDGSRYSDRLYLFENAELTHGFDNAWDGRKWEGDYRAPQLMTRTDNLDLAVDASPSFDRKQIAFRAGEDQEYILRFSTDIVGLRFRDLLTGAEMNITDGGEYLFTATNTESEVRFEIGDSRQIVDVPTSADQLDHFSDEVLAVDVFTPDGRCVLHRTTNFNESLLLPQSGIYIIRLQTTAGVKVQKITIQ